MTAIGIAFAIAIDDLRLRTFSIPIAIPIAIAMEDWATDGRRIE